GVMGSQAWWVPGTPHLSEGDDLVLMLRPADRHPGEFCLVEFALGHFKIVADEAGRQFATRPAFPPEEDRPLSRISRFYDRGTVTLRDMSSFLMALRTEASGEPMPDVQYATPIGPLVSSSTPSLSPKWVNVGGREPGDPSECNGTTPCLYRWFWDTGQSPL